MPLLNEVKKFFEKNLSENSHYLLGLSGGVDSMALFDLLCKLKKEKNFFLHLIYVDHGLREESATEARALKQIVEERNLVDVFYHTEKVEGVLLKANIEDKLRIARYKIFSTYYQKIKADGLFLAHHKDDVAETVFKRIFEGASLGKLSGLVDVSYQKEMKILRPFLPFSKKELLSYVEKEGLKTFHDKTNEDERYLRSRMRKSLFPKIEEGFGKNAANSLVHLSEKMKQVQNYLEKKAQKFFPLLTSGPFGCFLDLTKEKIEPLELETFLRMFCEKQNILLSRKVYQEIIDCVLEKDSHKTFLTKEVEIVYEHGLLFFLKSHPKLFNSCQNVASLPFSFTLEEYIFTITEENTPGENFGPKAFFQGECYFSLPYKEGFALSYPIYSSKLEGKSLKRLFQEQKVPTFFRRWVFGIYQKEELVSHLLIDPRQNKEKFFKLTIRRRV